MEASSVVVDDYLGAFLAAEHLILQGRRRIAHFAGPPALQISQNRIRGYQDALKKYGLPLEEELLVFCGDGLEQENGSEAAQQMLNAGVVPDGIFAICDPIAIGIMLTLKKNHIRIPEEIAVVGFCDEPIARVVEPHLSSLVQPAFEIGAAAAQIFFNQIQGKNTTVENRVFSTHLVVRESSVKN
jgi:DNA-binding LacI/PurR family transcriptional regulator